jgi:hypothetical protein
MYLDLMRTIDMLKNTMQRGEMKERILRAMHVKNSFSRRDLALLTDARPQYVERVLASLLRTGEVIRAGRTRGRSGQWEGVYRLKDKDAFYLKHIKGRTYGPRRREEDLLVVKDDRF